MKFKIGEDIYARLNRGSRLYNIGWAISCDEINVVVRRKMPIDMVGKVELWGLDGLVTYDEFMDRSDEL